jgi:adenylate kinase family enzyme
MPRSKTFEMRIKEADTIIFYDLPLLLVLWRQTKRFFMYYNKVRPDMGGNNKQKYPFTLNEVKYALNFPTKELHAKIMAYNGVKKIVIIKRPKDEQKFLLGLK